MDVGRKGWQSKCDQKEAVRCQTPFTIADVNQIHQKREQQNHIGNKEDLREIDIGIRYRSDRTDHRQYGKGHHHPKQNRVIVIKSDDMGPHRDTGAQGKRGSCSGNKVAGKWPNPL